MKSRLLVCCVLVGCLSLLGSVAWADGIPVQNASFETTNALTSTCGTGCAFNWGPIPGWTMTGSGGSFQPNSTYFNLPLPNGNVVAFSSGGTISQDLGVSLLPETTYTLSVFVGERLDQLNTNYSIALMAGSTTLCTFSGSNASITPGTFADETCTYQSGATVPTGDLSIVLRSAGVQSDFDNVSVNANVPVPEPSSMGLLAVGLLCAIFLARYK